MALKVTYKSPPYRDKVLDFDDSVQTIRFGRTPGSEVPFPEDMAIVGHDHFGRRRQNAQGRAQSEAHAEATHQHMTVIAAEATDGDHRQGENDLAIAAVKCCIHNLC